jgi:hypothetical protein
VTFKTHEMAERAPDGGRCADIAERPAGAISGPCRRSATGAMTAPRTGGSDDRCEEYRVGSRR